MQKIDWNETITINRGEFLEKCANVSEKVRITVKDKNPLLIIACSVFGALLCSELFDDKEDEKQEEEK